MTAGYPQAPAVSLRRQNVYWRMRVARELYRHLKDMKAHQAAVEKLRDRAAENLEQADELVALMDRALAVLRGVEARPLSPGIVGKRNRTLKRAVDL